ncbi:hypothetical protein B0A49_13824, partial [Cryomyces minteri]
MAPIAKSADPSSAPLADYFFICGIESSQVFEERSTGAASPPLDATIEQDRALETGKIPRPTTPGSPNADGAKRRSRYSFEARKSIGSIIGTIDYKQPESNRSSTTLKGVHITGSALSDADFYHALRKFASERDTFLEEIQFTAGAVTTTPTVRPKPRPKTVRIANEDASNAGGTMRSGVGSTRRRLSTMNSKRQSSMARQCEWDPSVSSRAHAAVPPTVRSWQQESEPQISANSRDSPASVRTSKRLSGYNSVIPTPQPFQSEPDMHPLKRRYEPVMLDRYPPKNQVDEIKRRNPFPDYVPMFAFPNDVTVVSSDERPRSTWHGFAMTNGDNSKLHGICLIIWMPLNHQASDELERQCEEWRRANMSGEERELASSLGERLAVERAKLSRLLAQLPSASSGSDEREALEEDISAVEEKIGLMTDLLRPVRHGAASKIDGLTDGDTGLWIPRAYGVLGRDGALTSFWKEWLRAVVVPMTNGGVLRVPPSSPKLGMWQPMERYVVNLCAEALSPISSITQVEIAVRELRMYARKEATNEIPGSRNVDLYALFRALSISNIVALFEYALSEARIILLSSHTSMLHLASAALTQLLYPIKWAGVFIPVLPNRLIQALEAPCPYIVGIERRYENVELPEDDYVLVDLDQDCIESTTKQTLLPRQQRRKLMSLLQSAAPHHNQYGVPVGPPAYAVEVFPNDAFCADNASIFNQKAAPSALANFVRLNSKSFGDVAANNTSQSFVFNAFLLSRTEGSRSTERPSTGSTSNTTNSFPSSKNSPISSQFPNPPSTGVSRNDSGYALQASLREKRSGHFDVASRRNSTVYSHTPSRVPMKDITNGRQQFGFERMPTIRRPSHPFS